MYTIKNNGIVMNLKSGFKGLFILGICLSFLSLFFEWYSFQARDLEGKLVVFWNLYLFMGWNTIFPPNSWFNVVFMPNGDTVPFVMNVIYIGIMLISVYSVIFSDLEYSDNLEKGKKYAYVHILLLSLSGFYICIVPIYYLVSQELFFPYLVYMDFELEVTFYYSIAVGYILQCVAFSAMFPYSIYYYFTTTHFNNQNNTSETVLQTIITQVQESLDFDKLIAEEKVKLQLEPEEKKTIVHQEEEVNQIYNQFLETRRVK